MVANTRDLGGKLKEVDGVFVGPLPAEIIPANTSVDWSGVHWTMVLWPLPENLASRRRLLAHESFHRLQRELHLDPEDARNAHLDTLEGRVWLQLEWRALARALISSGADQVRAIQDASAFRRQRQDQFPGSTGSERRLDLNEGLAEYTGVVAGSADRPSAVWLTIARLTAPSEQVSFVRSFPYTSGPAYGLLLDERAPSWRAQLRSSSDLAKILAATVPSEAGFDTNERAKAYGVAELQASEQERFTRTEPLRARLKAKLIDGPTLTLPTGPQFQYGFDPNDVIPLEKGTFYPTLKAQDEWGNVEVTDGALVLPGRLVLAAPKDVKEYQKIFYGPGWTLNLKRGWKIIASDCKGCYLLSH